MPTSDHFPAAELARLCAQKGVHHAVISPGSRNAPLVIAFLQEKGISCLQVIDERSAAFFALGMAQQLRAPVALICTSGSAVLNYGPAIAEAFYQRIPLLVLTADRPEEWVDQGEGQAIRQQNVLALHMRRSIQLPRNTHDDLSRWHCGRLINEAIDTSMRPVPGPVHVNIPFAEPLYGKVDTHQRPARAIEQLPTESFVLPPFAEHCAGVLSTAGKVMVLAGQGSWDPSLLRHLRTLAALPQVAVLVESTSNLQDPAFIGCIDRVIEGIGEQNERSLRPEVLITFGGAVISKRIKGLLRKWKPEQHWNIDPGQAHFDTYQSLTRDIQVSPEVFLAQITDQVRPGKSSYRDDWNSLDADTGDRQRSFMRSAPYSDLTVFERLLEAIPERTDIHLANSTPARYAQLFERGLGHRYWSNRGTSGIDGCTSTAAGAAWVNEGITTLITGDIAFLYDSNALWNGHLTARLKIIVIDNGGGNIFRVIDGPGKDPALLPWFEAPHGRSIEKLVASYGLPYRQAQDHASLKDGLEWLYGEDCALEHGGSRPAVLHVITDAEVSPKVLRDHFDAVRGG
jgi:2-succinyl-5-enolpyruvyl-6-hydroxy-3-cyclohexene-1-carboxylate synthase